MVFVYGLGEEVLEKGDDEKWAQLDVSPDSWSMLGDFGRLLRRVQVADDFLWDERLPVTVVP